MAIETPERSEAPAFVAQPSLPGWFWLWLFCIVFVWPVGLVWSIFMIFSSNPRVRRNGMFVSIAYIVILTIGATAFILAGHSSSSSSQSPSFSPPVAAQVGTPTTAVSVGLPNGCVAASGNDPVAAIKVVMADYNLAVKSGSQACWDLIDSENTSINDFAAARSGKLIPLGDKIETQTTQAGDWPEAFTLYSPKGTQDGSFECPGFGIFPDGSISCGVPIWLSDN